MALVSKLRLFRRVESSVARHRRGSARSNATAAEQMLSKRLGGIKLGATAAKSHKGNQPPAGRKANDQPKKGLPCLSKHPGSGQDNGGRCVPRFEKSRSLSAISWLPIGPCRGCRPLKYMQLCSKRRRPHVVHVLIRAAHTLDHIQQPSLS
ncbi:hypothetical protein ACQKWADRAFT_277150 [Trichoderma austrokoningii]